MSDWKEYKLGEVVTWGNGKERPKDKGTIPVYGGNGVLDYTNRGNYAGETVIVGRVGAYCGSVFYTNQPIWVSDNALAAKPQNGNDAKFLYYFLRHLNLNGYAEGSTHPLVTQRLLNSIDVVIPSLDEQKQIAGVLSSLDDKIDLLNRENATLEALAETLFRHYFIENPNPDWKEGKLGDIAIIAAGGDKPKNVSNNRTTDTPIPIFSNGIEKDGLYGYTDIAKVFDECVTVSARGTIGFVALRTEPFVPIVRLITLIPKKTMTSKFLYYWAKSADITGTGTTQQQLTVPDFKETKLLVPDSSSVMDFTEKVNVLHYKKKSNQQQILSLSAQRDTLLPRLMSGEVKVIGQ